MTNTYIAPASLGHSSSRGSNNVQTTLPVMTVIYPRWQGRGRGETIESNLPLNVNKLATTTPGAAPPYRVACSRAGGIAGGWLLLAYGAGDCAHG
jgi:hypothetical protein